MNNLLDPEFPLHLWFFAYQLVDPKGKRFVEYHGDLYAFDYKAAVANATAFATRNAKASNIKLTLLGVVVSKPHLEV